MRPSAVGNAIVAAVIAAALTLAAASAAITVTQEPPAGQFRPGQRVLVDDGSCPAGQIKEVVDVTNGTAGQPIAGVRRIRHCIRR